MKKISFIAGCLLLSLPLLSTAQYAAGDQEASFSYGRQSGTDIIRGFEFNRTPPSLDHATYNSATAKSGDFFLSYSYCLSRRLAIGLTAGTEFVSFGHYANYDPPGAGELMGSFKASVTTAAFELKPIYYNGRLMQLYGFFGLGARYYAEKLVSGENNTPGKTDDFPSLFINTQWTPIGFHIGKTLSGFLEFGIGYKGLINAGISYKLARKAKPVVAKAQ